MIRLFNEFQRNINPDVVEFVYHLFKGHTFYMQRIFNEAFSNTMKGKNCDRQIINDAIESILNDKETTYKEILSEIPEKQKPLLYAIAREGTAVGLTSTTFLKRHGLPSASSVQSAVKHLLNQGFITVIHQKYSVTDKFFALWINRIYNEKTESNSVFY